MPLPYRIALYCRQNLSFCRLSSKISRIVSSRISLDNIDIVSYTVTNVACPTLSFEQRCALYSDHQHWSRSVQAHICRETCYWTKTSILWNTMKRSSKTLSNRTHKSTSWLQGECCQEHMLKSILLRCNLEKQIYQRFSRPWKIYIFLISRHSSRTAFLMTMGTVLQFLSS